MARARVIAGSAKSTPVNNLVVAEGWCDSLLEFRSSLVCVPHIRRAELVSSRPPPLAASRGSCKTAMAMPFTVADAESLNAAGQVQAPKKAHRILKQLRDELSGPLVNNEWTFTSETIDLTDGQRIDWRRYLANRTVAELRRCIGPGVVRFEGRFVTAFDCNIHHGQRDTRQRRFDFVAHRVDGQATRFHPSGSGDTHPIVGNVAWWSITGGDLAMLPVHVGERLHGDVPPGPPAGLVPAGAQAQPAQPPPPQSPSPGPHPQPSRGDAFVYHAAGQHDFIGDRDARNFLAGRVQEWEQALANGQHTRFTKERPHPAFE